jgi:hypothetical protein
VADDTTLAARQKAVFARLCDHLDGLAIATTVAGLRAAGALAGLGDAPAGLPVGAWAAYHGLRPGYANLAGRLLALQGLAVRGGDIAGGAATLRLTDAGRDWLRWQAAYDNAVARINAARLLLGALEEGGDAPAGTRPAADLAVPTRIRNHCRGAVVAAAMTGLARTGLLDQLAQAAAGLPLESLSAAAVAALDRLAGEGWVTKGDNIACLTVDGRIAAAMAPQYFYPVGYLALLGAVPRLLTGGEADELAVDLAGAEGHVDRELDIAFSGVVFARTCQAPFFELALPLFDALPLDRQPRAVVDCGGGDGTLLCALYRAIAERTARGAALADAPLTMIGVEYNPVAERALAARLRAEGVPGYTFAGDIRDPAAIAARLAADGFTPDDVLHVSKSVFHNRRYRGEAVPFADAASLGAFVAPDGGAIGAGAIEADLAAALAAWRAHLGNPGMIVIEAHLVDEALTAARPGASVLPVVEALHGYSHQYLVEIDVHRRAAERAGLRALARRDFGTAFAGAPIISIDRYAA